MSETVFVQGPNGLVIGHRADVAAGLLRHPDHKKVAAPEPKVPAAPEPPADGKPAGNASLESWQAYALANGKTGADIDGLKQGEIRALFTEA